MRSFHSPHHSVMQKMTIEQFPQSALEHPRFDFSSLATLFPRLPVPSICLISSLQCLITTLERFTHPSDISQRMPQIRKPASLLFLLEPGSCFAEARVTSEPIEDVLRSANGRDLNSHGTVIVQGDSHDCAVILLWFATHHARPQLLW